MCNLSCSVQLLDIEPQTQVLHLDVRWTRDGGHRAQHLHPVNIAEGSDQSEEAEAEQRTNTRDDHEWSRKAGCHSAMAEGLDFAHDSGRRHLGLWVSVWNENGDCS